MLDFAKQEMVPVLYRTVCIDIRLLNDIDKIGQ